MGEKLNELFTLTDDKGRVIEGKVVKFEGKLKTDEKGKELLAKVRKEAEDEQKRVGGLLLKKVEDEVMRVSPQGMDSKVLADVQKLQIDFGYKIAVVAWNECLRYHRNKYIPDFTR